MKCKCKCETKVRRGEPIEEGGKAYWQQIFFCDNPQCPNYKKDIGLRKVNIFDETDIIEESSL